MPWLLEMSLDPAEVTPFEGASVGSLLFGRVRADLLLMRESRVSSWVR